MVGLVKSAGDASCEGATGAGRSDEFAVLDFAASIVATTVSDESTILEILLAYLVFFVKQLWRISNIGRRLMYGFAY